MAQHNAGAYCMANFVAGLIAVTAIILHAIVLRYISQIGPTPLGSRPYRRLLSEHFAIHFEALGVGSALRHTFVVGAVGQYINEHNPR